MSDEVDGPIRSLVVRLIGATERGAIRWKTTDTPAEFLYSGTSSGVSIGSADRDGVGPFVLTLYDDSGAEVDTARSSTYWNPEYESHFVADSEWNDDLERLYKAARRSALKIDEIVNSLLADIPGPPAPWDDAEEPF